MAKELNDTSFVNYPLLIKGKVRDVYDLGDRVLIIATDRISAFDCIFPNLIPGKGIILNRISEFWFDFTKDVIPNHMITCDINEFPEDLQKFKEELAGRSMIVKKVKMLEAECIVRGYLEGSGLKEYKSTGSICGVELPEGLVQAQKLPEYIFTPTTKAKSGHDMSVTFEQLSDEIGKDLAVKLKEASLALFKKASDHADKCGLILADTKFEFGILDGELIVADEIFTPDSSRFWVKSEYKAGRAQKSFDKQFVREYLETLDWDKTPPAPKLPEAVIEKTIEKYMEAYEKLSGKKLKI